MSSSANRPQPVYWQPRTTRLFNLVLALLHSNTPRSTDWLCTNVVPYRDQPLANARRNFYRDQADLAEIGVELEQTDVEGEWQLRPEGIFMPELDLSSQDLELLAQFSAENLYQSCDNTDALNTGLLKLVGAGARPPTAASVVRYVPDRTELSVEDLKSLYRAIDQQLHLTFWYYPALEKAPEERRIEPWAVGGRQGIVYLTGFDIQRQQQRTFRLSRIGDLRVCPDFSQHPRPTSEQGEELSTDELLALGQENLQELVTVRLRFEGKTAQELRNLCEWESDQSNVGRIGSVDRAWLVRTAASYAPHVVVLEPREIAEEVYSLLSRAAHNCQPGASPSLIENFAEPVWEEESLWLETSTIPSVHAHSWRSAQDQFLGAYALLQWLQRHPQESLLAASRDLDMSIPQIKHFIQQLNFCGLPDGYPGSLLEIVVDKTTAEVRENLGLKAPLRLTQSETLVLLLRLEALRGARSVPVTTFDSLRTALLQQLYPGYFPAPTPPSLASPEVHTVAASLPDSTVADDEVTGDNEVNRDDDVADEESDQNRLLEQLKLALVYRCTVSVDYDSRSSDQVRRRTLVPDELFEVQGKLYLSAREVDGAQSKTFALRRMGQPTLGEPGSAGLRMVQEIDPDDPFGFGDVLKQQWEKVILAPHARWMLEYFPMWVEGESSAEDEPLTVSMPDTGNWLVRFLLGYAQEVRPTKNSLHLLNLVWGRADAGLRAYAEAHPGIGCKVSPRDIE